MEDSSFRPHGSFSEFLKCTALFADREKRSVMARGANAAHLWMLGPDLLEFHEFSNSDGIEVLRNIWERAAELKAGGKGAIKNALAAGLKGKFPEDNSDILAGAVWSCFLLHGGAQSGQHGQTESTAQHARRKGYRAEVRQWMQHKNLANLDQASKRLKVSESTLKSIMSDKGKLRYGAATLERVLREIGYKNG